MFYLLRPFFVFAVTKATTHLLYGPKVTQMQMLAHTSQAQNLFVQQCLVCVHHSEIFAQATKRKQLSPSSMTIETDLFIYEILSKDVGKETNWQLSETTSVCL